MISTQKMVKDSWYIPVISSATAGAVVVTVMQPIWLIKTRLQLQTRHVEDTLYKNPYDALVKTIKCEGKSALYKGMSASYLGLTETVLQFTIYETLKNKLSKSKSETERSLGIVEVLLISSISKLIASGATYPHEVIRTRLREQKDKLVTKYKGPLQGLAVIAREEGLKGLYGGMEAHLIRVVPNAAILFLTYELTLAYFSKVHLKD